VWLQVSNLHGLSKPLSWTTLSPVSGRVGAEELNEAQNLLYLGYANLTLTGLLTGFPLINTSNEIGLRGHGVFKVTQ